MDALRLEHGVSGASSGARAAQSFAPSHRLADLQRQLGRLLPRTRIAVIYGGDKSAAGAVINQTVNRRPWKSYQAVAEDIAAALRRVGLGEVHLIADDMSLGDRLRHHAIDMAWLNTAGVQGFHSVSHAAAMLEMFGVPYVGHDPLKAGMLDNKHIFKRDLTSLGLPTAPFMTWTQERGPFQPELNSQFFQTFGHYRGPFIVKPVSGRASLHVHVVDQAAGLTDIVAKIYRATENDVLIEPYLVGREYCVSVCGPVTAQDGHLFRRAEPFVFSAVERVLGPDERIFTSMDRRPITADRMRLLSPAEDTAELTRLHDLARTVYLEFNLESLVRIDLRADAVGRLCVLEANPKPDLKRPSQSVTSLVCAGLADNGMDYDDLVLSLLADRLDLLLRQRPASVARLTRLSD